MSDITQKKRGRGRPPGSPNKKKVPAPPKAKRAKTKLRPHPDDAKKQYARMFSDLDAHAIYGLDDFTEALLETLWKDSTVEVIYCTDPNPDRLANKNRFMGGRSFSMYRWFAMSTSDFFEHPLAEVIVVSKKHYEEAVRRNKYDIPLIVLEEL